MNLDYDGLKAALKTAQAVKGGVGEILDISPDTVLVKKESSAHHKAQEILNTIQKGDQPNTANREGPINLAYTILANPYFDNDAYWGMMDSSKKTMKFGFQLKEGMPLTLDPQNIDYLSKEIQYTSGTDFQYGFNDMRNIMLSTGANA